MIDEMLTTAITGVAAGLGVAMPMGAIAALLLREGLVSGFRVSAAAAAGIAAVDVIYCAGAVATGATFVRAIEEHRGVFLFASGVFILAVAVTQLRKGLTERPSTAQHFGRVSARRTFIRFVGLTAINPITLVYFVALSGAVTTAGGGSWVGPAVFVTAVGVSSLTWQLVLVCAGSFFGATAPPGAARLVSVIASLLVGGLGIAVVINGFTAF